MRQVVITSAVRLPIGRFLGSLKEVHTGEMGATVAKAALDRSGIEGSCVDEVVTSETYRGDLPGCSARPIGLKAGVPLEVPGFNLNMHCGTGLKAVVLASQMIRCGDADVVLVITVESMSRAAFFLRNARAGFRLGHATVVDQLVQKGDPARDPRLDPTAKFSMGETAENLAAKYSISRERQDEYALRSQQRAAEAMREDRFASQLVPIEVPRGRNETALFDEGLSARSLFVPAFAKASAGPPRSSQAIGVQRRRTRAWRLARRSRPRPIRAGLAADALVAARQGGLRFSAPCYASSSSLCGARRGSRSSVYDPFRKASSSSTRFRKGAVVWIGPIASSDSALRMVSIASSRVAPCVITLASNES